MQWLWSGTDRPADPRGAHRDGPRSRLAEAYDDRPSVSAVHPAGDSAVSVHLSDDLDRIDDLDPPAAARAWVHSSLWLLGVLSGVIVIAAATGVPEPAFETLVTYSIGAASVMLTIALFAVVWQVNKSARLHRRQIREARHRAGRRRS
jgi:hypothetical protein